MHKQVGGTVLCTWHHSSPNNLCQVHYQCQSEPTHTSAPPAPPPWPFSTEGDKPFSPFSFDIFCEVVLFVLIFLSARLVFSDLLYHFAFPLRLASTSFPQVLESTRVQLSGYLRALWRRSLPRHWQVHRGEKEVHGSEIQ